MFWEGHVVSLVDDVENEVEDGGEGCDLVLSAGGDSNRVVSIGRNNEVGIGRDGELVVNSCSKVCLSSKVSASQIFIILP